MNIPVLVLETLAGGCFLLSAALTYKEIGEINRKLPDDKQVARDLADRDGAHIGEFASGEGESVLCLACVCCSCNTFRVV